MYESLIGCVTVMLVACLYYSQQRCNRAQENAKYWAARAREERDCKYKLATEVISEKNNTTLERRKVLLLVPALEYYADLQEPNSKQSNFVEAVGPRGTRLGIMEKGAMTPGDINKIGTYALSTLERLNRMCLKRAK